MPRRNDFSRCRCCTRNGKCCIAGCEKSSIEKEKYFEVDGKRYSEGDSISLNGSTGNVYDGFIKMVEANLGGYFKTIMDWADETRRMEIRTNADTPKDAQTALHFGAEGIGLCRTEHMFFESSRILEVRKMIFVPILWSSVFQCS
jgi:pyruvate,orthophosphate dikinase